MKLLSSPWVLGILAIMLSLGINVFFVMSTVPAALDIFIPEPEPEEVIEDKPKFWTFRSREISNLVASIKEQESSIAKQLAELKALRESVISEQKELESAKAEIAQIKADIAKRIVTIEQSELDNMKELISTYVIMPPDVLVDLFKQFDDPTILKVLSQFKPDMVAQIFQSMLDAAEDKEKAVKRVAELTELMRLRVVE